MDNQNDRLDDPQNLLDVDDAVQPDERAWYVIHCYSGYENKVRHSIEPVSYTHLDVYKRQVR